MRLTNLPVVTGWIILTTCCLWGCWSATNSTGSPSAVVQKDLARWQTLTNSAERAFKAGDIADAEDKYKAALVEALKAGDDSPDVANSMSNLADFYYVQGDGQQADKLYTQSIALKKKIFGQESKDIARDLLGLGEVKKMEQDYAQAANNYSDALTIEMNMLPVNDPLVIDTKRRLQIVKLLAKASEQKDASTKH